MKSVEKLFTSGFTVVAVMFLLFGIVGCSNPANKGEITHEELPKTNKEAVDVLVLMYMDGDNSLNSAIWEDFNEVEVGLSKLKNNTSKVDVITLFDGSKGNDTMFFKMGADSKLNNDKSPEAIDLSPTAPWIFTKDNRKEVSMSSRETVENFLVWAKNSYDIKPETKVILQFSNHGAGPISYNNYSRAMCEDWNKVNKNDATLLLTRDVPIAIKNSGIGKIDLVIQDVCFGGNIEEVYEYRDVADYMLLSPNSMPGKGLNYVSVIGNLQNEECLKEGKLDIPLYLNENVKEFKQFYNCDDSLWDTIKQDLINADPNDDVKDDSYFDDEAGQIGLSLITRIPVEGNNGQRFQFDIPTITAVNVNKINEVALALNKIAELVINNKKEFKYQNGEVKSYGNYLQFIFRQFNSYMIGGVNTENSLSMYDISVLADNIIYGATKNFETANDWPELEQAGKLVKDKMRDAVIASWRDGYKRDLYYKDYTVNNNVETYGLAVSGLTYFEKKEYGEMHYYVKGLENYYNNELAFGQETKWKDFLYETIN